MNIAMPPDEFWLGLLLAIVVVVLLSLIFYWNDSPEKKLSDDVTSYLIFPASGFSWKPQETEQESETGRSALVELAKRIADPAIQEQMKHFKKKPWPFSKCRGYFAAFQTAVESKRFYLACYELRCLRDATHYEIDRQTWGRIQTSIEAALEGRGDKV